LIDRIDAQTDQGALVAGMVGKRDFIAMEGAIATDGEGEAVFGGEVMFALGLPKQGCASLAGGEGGFDDQMPGMNGTRLSGNPVALAVGDFMELAAR
jgi:hypothetical protein